MRIGSGYLQKILRIKNYKSKITNSYIHERGLVYIEQSMHMHVMKVW